MLERSHLDRIAGFEPKDLPEPRCANCGYNLTGAPTNRCPECGEVWTIRDVRRVMASDQEAVFELRSVNTMIHAGMWFCVTGAVLVVMGWMLGLMGGGAAFLGKFLGITCAAIGGLMSVNVLRLFRISKEIRGRVAVRVDTWRAGLSFSLLLLTALLCIAL